MKRVHPVLVIGLVQVVTTALDLHQYGAGTLRWLEPLTLALACFAAVPLEDPPRRAWPLRRQLRSPYGLLGVALLTVSLALTIWRVTHRP